MRKKKMLSGLSKRVIDEKTLASHPVGYQNVVTAWNEVIDAMMQYERCVNQSNELIIKEILALHAERAVLHGAAKESINDDITYREVQITGTIAGFNPFFESIKKEMMEQNESIKSKENNLGEHSHDAYCNISTLVRGYCVNIDSMTSEINRKIQEFKTNVADLRKQIKVAVSSQVDSKNAMVVPMSAEVKKFVDKCIARFPELGAIIKPELEVKSDAKFNTERERPQKNFEWSKRKSKQHEMWQALAKSKSESAASSPTENMSTGPALFSPKK